MSVRLFALCIRMLGNIIAEGKVRKNKKVSEKLKY